MGSVAPEPASARRAALELLGSLGAWLRRPAAWLLPCPLALACAPSQSFRPAGALGPDREHELGIAVSSVRPRPYVTEPAQEVGQAWWSTKLGGPWSLTTLLAFDASALAGGAALRLDAVRTRRISIAAEAEGGFAWAALSVPASLRIVDDVGVYCSPRLGTWGANVTPFVPCGLQGELFHGLILRGEAQLSWADFQAYNRRMHWGLGVAYQW